MHWELHITEFQNIEGKNESDGYEHSCQKFKLRDYNIANREFKTLSETTFYGMKIFHNGLTKVGIYDKCGEKQWFMVALTLEKGWA